MAQTEETTSILNLVVNYDTAIDGIYKYTQSVDELKTKLKELEKQKGEKTPEYYKELERTKSALTQQSETLRVLRKEMQNNIRQEREKMGSLKAMRAALSNLTKQYDELSFSERKAKDNGVKLANEIRDLTQKIKAAEQDTDRFYRNVGNYENSIISALGGNNRFAQSFLSLRNNAGGISGVVTQATTSVRAFGSALLSLLANPVFLAFAGIAGTGVAFKWFYDYNKGLIEATRLTREFTGLTGDALESLRNEIQATADLFDKDYKEVLQGVNTLMAQYGINAEEAIKIVNDGFIAGADLSGNYLNQLKQYAPAFHDMGLSAEQLVALIAQTRSGIFSEQGMALVQMAGKRLREMSNETAKSLDAIGVSSQKVRQDLATGSADIFEIIQRISGALKELNPNSQAVGAVLKDVFGRQGASGGLEMIKALETISTDIDAVKEKTGEYGKTQERMLKAQKELNDATSALFDMSQNGFGTMNMEVKILATEGLSSVLKYIIEIINYLINLYNESIIVRAVVQSYVIAWKNVYAAAKLAFNLIFGLLKRMGNDLMAVGKMVEGVFSLNFGKVAEGFAQLGKGTIDYFKGAWQDIKSFGGDVASNFVDGFNATISNSKIRQISLPTGGGVSSAQGGLLGGGGVTTNNANNNATGGTGGGSNGNKSGNADLLKREAQEIQKAEQLLTKIVTQNYEERRAQITHQYDAQIALIRQKLATETNLTAKAREAMNTQIVTLEKIKQQELDKLSAEEMRKRVEFETKRIELMLTSVKEGTMEWRQLELVRINEQEQLAIAQAQKEYTDEEQREAMLLALRANFDQQRLDLENKYQEEWRKKQEEAIKTDYETQILGAHGDELEQLRLKMEERKAILDAAQQGEEESLEQFNLRKAQLNEEYLNSVRSYTDKEFELQKAQAKAIGDVLGGLSSIAEAFGEENEALAKASKVLALGQIAVSTGVAIAEGVKQAQSVPFPANIAAIATTVATVLANIATAVKSVKSAKFASGGYVSGAGTGTSDSISARLSNGESVMTANTTSMFAPALSAFNQLGGGVPIVTANPQMQMGEDFLASAVAKGFASAPQPVVAVEEINRVDARMVRIEELSTI